MTELITRALVLEHYSRLPLGPLKDVVQTYHDYFKPQGFWVSVPGEDDWPAWCGSENWNLENFAHCTRFNLTPDHKVLHLKTVADIDAFHESFKISAFVGAQQCYIDWPRVAHHFDGLIIAPYQWARRLDGEAHRWYYGWDCASGCIWRTKALERQA